MSNLESHANIVNLIGACATRLTCGELYIVVELCELGNLRDFLIKPRATLRDADGSGLEAGDRVYITAKDLTELCHQIAMRWSSWLPKM